MRPTERVTVEEGPMASPVAFGKGIQSLVSDDPVHERAKKNLNSSFSVIFLTGKPEY